MDKHVKAYIQENRENINNAQWSKVLDPVKLWEDLSPNCIEELISILQKIGLPKNIDKVFPNFTDYMDYENYDDVLAELKLKYTLQGQDETVKDIEQNLWANGIIIRDILYDGTQENFNVKDIIVCSDVDTVIITLILKDKDGFNAAYISIEDKNFSNNIIKIPGLGIAYNKNKILSIFKKYLYQML